MEHHYILYIFLMQFLLLLRLSRSWWWHAQSEMDLYFSDPAHDISCLQRHPLVMKVFIQKNVLACRQVHL